MDICGCDPIKQASGDTCVDEDVEYCSTCGKPTRLPAEALATNLSRWALVKSQPELLPEPPPMSRPAIVSFGTAVVAYLLWSVPMFVDVWAWPSRGLSVGDIGGFVVALLFIVAFVTGIVGIVGTTGHKRRGRGFAVAGLLLSLLCVLGVFLVLLFLGIAMTGG